jgi:hypothetical protein
MAMRLRTLLVAVVPILGGCVHAVSHFRPALPDQAVAGQPEAGIATAAGVRLVATAGDWRGWPDDLEEHLTPVEVLIENRSGRSIRIRHDAFGLVDANGFRHPALDPREVRRTLLPYGPHAYVHFHYGFFGAYPWPGFYFPWAYPYYPYSWWGPWGVGIWAEPSWGAYAPRPGPEGALENGGQVSVLLFFPVPALELPGLDLVADLVDQASGAPLATIRIPFVRAAPGAASRPAPPPPPARAPPPAAAPAPPAPAPPAATEPVTPPAPAPH